MRAHAGERGTAILLALVTTALLVAVGVSLLVATDVERQVAANARYSLEALAAAEAAVERVLVDLRNADDWSPFLGGTAHSSFWDGVTRVNLPAGGVLEVAVVTAEIQAESSALGSFGSNTPVWRLTASGALSSVAPSGVIDSLQYLSVWLADDVAETDGNPQADTNGIVMLRGESRGPGGARRVVEMIVRRTSGSGVQVAEWREGM